MALRRTLPSRMTPEKPPEGAATPSNQPENKPEARSEGRSGNRQDNRPDNRSNNRPDDNRNAASAAKPSAAPANPFGDAVLPEPVTPLVMESSAAAAAIATSAFSTLPTAPASAPARVLEDSFIKSAPEAVTAPAPKPEPVITPAPEPEFVAPAWQTPAVAEALVAVPEVTFEPLPTPAVPPEAIEPPEPEPAPEPKFFAPAWDVPAAEPAPAIPAVAEVATPEPAAPAPVAAVPEPAFVAPAWQVPAVPPQVLPVITAPVGVAPEEPVAPQFQPEPQASVADEDVPAQPLEVSRPDDMPIRRRVREKRPRDFNAMGAPENAAAERPRPVTTLAPNVPLDTRPIDKVDEDLIASGIMAGPQADSLTGNLPTGVAEMTFLPAARPEPVAILQPEPPAPQPEPQPAPLPPVAPAPAPFPAYVPPAAPQQAAPSPAPAPGVSIPVTVSAPVGTPIPVPAATPAPAPAAALPSSSPFNLSNTPVASAPLPPPQSDLPWTQVQTAAEWEIETPAESGWSPETGHDNPSATPSPAHMPPPADLYKPMGSGSSASAPSFGTTPGSGIPPRGGTNFTPELPGQRRKTSGGTPWTLILIGAVAVGGGAAWYLRSGGMNQAQQQLANLTTPAPATPAAPADMLQPPRTENASFYTPPSTVSATAGADASPTSVVNFADVPADQANQPIVATGKEEIPQSFFGKLGTEIDKARARKEAGLPADASGTLPAPTATASAAGSPYTPEKFQQEMAAYRSALAQSANPAALKPAAFLRDPDGYMDGKPQNAPVASGTAADGSPMASGALLPPPAAAGGSGGALPPPELYTNNPKNLPVVAEPIANAPQRVRTLADFSDVEPYAPEKEKVEIPKNLKPKMAATDFPSLEVLSFVPDKGIVAFADGREGVLLIGESINGWTLVGVSADHAEFKTGEKSYQVTADNQ